MVAHIERQEADDGHRVRAVAARTVLIVHRHQWFTGPLSQSLADDDTAVPYVIADGAEGIGIMVAEQPDVVVIEDRLSSVTAVDFVTRARVLAPRTAVAVQIATAETSTEVLTAGARAVFTRRLAPADAAQHVKALLTAGAGPTPPPQAVGAPSRRLPRGM